MHTSFCVDAQVLVFVHTFYAPSPTNLQVCRLTRIRLNRSKNSNHAQQVKQTYSGTSHTHMGLTAVQAHGCPLTKQLTPDGQHLRLTLLSRSGIAAWLSHARGPFPKCCLELSSNPSHARSAAILTYQSSKSAPLSLAHLEFQALHTASPDNAIVCHQRSELLPQSGS